MILAYGMAAGEQNPDSAWNRFGQPEVTAAVTATPAPNAFRFRDGIRWGMNAMQVRALEPEQMTERSMSDWSVLFTEGKVTVSRFTADLVFMFRADRLMMATYEFSRETRDSFQYISAALSSVYGDKTDADPLVVKSLMDAVNPNRYRTDLITDSCVWTTADGTTIYLYHYSSNDFAIMYVSPEQGTRVYQTNGL